MVKSYKKKPVVISAVVFTTNNDDGDKNMNDIVNWMNGCSNGVARHDGTNIYIQTLEGEMRASVGDYIIRGVNGEFYPCKPDVFAKTYDVVE